jgi:hypothetical protein
MGDQKLGWLYVISDKAHDNRISIRYSSEDPDEIIRWLNRHYRNPRYILQYKRYLKGPTYLRKKIRSRLDLPRDNGWYNCARSHITSIVRSELVNRISKSSEKTLTVHPLARAIKKLFCLVLILITRKD